MIIENFRPFLLINSCNCSFQNLGNFNFIFIFVADLMIIITNYYFYDIKAKQIASMPETTINYGTKIKQGKHYRHNKECTKR